MRARAILLAAVLACGCRQPREEERGHGIISLVPSATEILFALGAGDEVVGVSDYCSHPPEAARLPRYGGFLDPSVERILTSGARAVVVQGEAHDLERACEDAGLEVVKVWTNDLADMDAAIEALGGLVGRPEEARRLREGIHAQIDAAAASVPAGSRPRVVVVVDRAPDDLKRIFVAGPGSLLDDLLAAVGAENAFADADRPYPMVSLETILGREPDAILDLRPLARSRPGSLGRAEALWKASGILAPDGPVAAVHVLETTDFTVHGPRTGQAARSLAAIVHGGAP
jgi:iron complex transport system substrate-binding protein